MCHAKSTWLEVSSQNTWGYEYNGAVLILSGSCSEKAALRREAGLATAIDWESVQAKCTAFRGLDGASCLHEAQGSNILGTSLYSSLPFFFSSLRFCLSKLFPRVCV